MVEVYDRRPVQANELLRIQFRFKRPNTLPQQVPLAGSMQTDITISGLDPLDVTHRHHRSREGPVLCREDGQGIFPGGFFRHVHDKREDEQLRTSPD